jgi:hypothetical protein
MPPIIAGPTKTIQQPTDSLLGKISVWIDANLPRTPSLKEEVSASAPDRADELAESDAWFKDYWAGSGVGDMAASIFTQAINGES